MDHQPNEIVQHILSFLDNHHLMIVRRVNKRWQHIIENKIFYRNPIPSLFSCLLTSNYYHYVKYYNNVEDDDNYSIYKELVKIRKDEVFLRKFPLDEEFKFDIYYSYLRNVIF